MTIANPIASSLFLFLFSVCCAYVTRMLRCVLYPLRIPCANLILYFQKTHDTLTLWHFCFLCEIFETLRLSSLNRYLPSIYKVSPKSHSLKFSSQNSICFASLSLFRSPIQKCTNFKTLETQKGDGPVMVPWITVHFLRFRLNCHNSFALFRAWL